MLQIYLSIYKRLHNIFKAFSVSEKQINDYTSNIFVFSFIISLNFVALFFLINKVFNIDRIITFKWFFVIMAFSILITNTIIIYKNKEQLETIDLSKYNKVWLVFIGLTILLQFWPILYIF